MARRLPTAVLLGLAAVPAVAQVRGVYPTGMNAVNAGGLPAPGWSYSNMLILNTRDERLGGDGEVLETGEQAVALDLNTFAWSGEGTLAGGTRLAATATVILSRNSLTSDTDGTLGEGSGLGDLFVQPLILGWSTPRAEFKAAYGFVAPTGRFEAGADDNVGSGYWTHALSGGATLRLGETRANTASAFVMLEFHGRQEGTDIRPGNTLNMDASLMHAFDIPGDAGLQVGVAGYGQWQVSDRSGPGLAPDAAADRYRVFAVGVAGQYAAASGRSGFGIRLFREFEARSTTEGISLQLSASIAF